MSQNIKFSYEHIKMLYSTNQIEEAKIYFKKFFFRHGTQIFFFDGIKFILRDQKETMKLIPDDLSYVVLTPNVNNPNKSDKEIIKAKSFFTSTEFLEVEYEPTIDFKRELTFQAQKKIQGYDFTYNYLNCAKPINIDLPLNLPEIEEMLKDKSYIDKLNIVYNHFLNVLSNHDEKLCTYILNFVACSIAGRNLERLYISNLMKEQVKELYLMFY